MTAKKGCPNTQRHSSNSATQGSRQRVFQVRLTSPRTGDARWCLQFVLGSHRGPAVPAIALMRTQSVCRGRRLAPGAATACAPRALCAWLRAVREPLCRFPLPPPPSPSLQPPPRAIIAARALLLCLPNGAETTGSSRCQLPGVYLDVFFWQAAGRSAVSGPPETLLRRWPSALRRPPGPLRLPAPAIRFALPGRPGAPTYLRPGRALESLRDLRARARHRLPRGATCYSTLCGTRPTSRRIRPPTT